MGAKQTKEDETPTSPKSPRVSPVDIASDETPVPGLFYRSRLEYITETASIAKCLKLAQTEDEDSIKERLKEALAQHEEDASEEDTSAQLNTKRALRKSEEKIAAMETKIDELTVMLQTLIDKK